MVKIHQKTSAEPKGHLSCGLDCGYLGLLSIISCSNVRPSKARLGFDNCIVPQLACMKTSESDIFMFHFIFQVLHWKTLKEMR